jgi:hypothetical protein
MFLDLENNKYWCIKGLFLIKFIAIENLRNIGKCVVEGFHACFEGFEML